MRDLYAVAAERWVAEGLTSHYAMVPATDPALVDAWFRLGFGHQHVHAIREAPAARKSPEAPPGLTLRLARRDDVDALAMLDVALPEHQALSPVFSRLTLPTVDEMPRPSTRRTSTTPSFTTFIVERDGVVIGSAIACPLEVSSTHKSLALSPGAGFLGFASVLPERARLGRWTPARRGDAPLGARDGPRLGRHRLADDEPAVVPCLAEARFPADVLPPPPRDRVRSTKRTHAACDRRRASIPRHGN